MAAQEVRRGRLAGVVALLALAATVALSWALQRPPTPVPASAAPTEFSAQRAYADLQRIAGPEPTPIGSIGSDAIRDHLVSALSAAGFTVEVQTGVGSQTRVSPCPRHCRQFRSRRSAAYGRQHAQSRSRAG
jgi:hypothetical protein